MTTMEQLAEFHTLLPWQVEHYWPKIEECLDASPEAWADNTKESLYNGLMSGHYVMWALSDEGGIAIIVITQVQDQPARRVLWVHYAFGRNLERFLPLAQPAFALVAKRLKCSHVTITGRRGWLRVLRGIGFREESVNITMEVQTETLQ